MIWSSPQGRLTRPRSTYSMELAYRAAVEFEMTGRIPSPEEVADKSLAWYADVYLQLDWRKFHKDQLKPADPMSKGGNSRK